MKVGHWRAAVLYLLRQLAGSDRIITENEGKAVYSWSLGLNLPWWSERASSCSRPRAGDGRPRGGRGREAKTILLSITIAQTARKFLCIRVPCLLSRAPLPLPLPRRCAGSMPTVGRVQPLGAVRIVQMVASALSAVSASSLKAGSETQTRLPTSCTYVGSGGCVQEGGRRCVLGDCRRLSVSPLGLPP